MKQSFWAVAILGGFVGAAAAQSAPGSSVTLFGVIDVGIRYNKNGDQSLWTQATSGLQSSRFGVRGVESLGGTLSAGFHLEAGLSADAGTADATKFWGRRSTVSLVDSRLGELRFGRDLTPIWTGFANYDVFNTNGVADAGKFDSALGSGAVTATRSDNMVAYYTPALGGPFLHLAVAPSEGTGGTKFWGARAGYIAGPLDTTVSYGATNDTANRNKWKKGSFGISYNFGPVVLLSYLTRNQYIDQKLDIGQIGFRVPVGAHTLRANYTKVNAKGRTAANVSIARDDANQWAVGHIYDFSKRSSIYSTVTRVDNKGNARYLVQAAPATAVGRQSTGFEIGLRHAF